MIGVYTDLKVKTLLTGLRMLYNIPNLAVSDTLTASATLERHLAGLDFAAKVLGVEVIHGVNDLVRFLGGSGDVKDESSVVTADSFARYQSYFQDQQNVLAYETQRLQEYTILTEQRSRDVYETVKRSNKFLLAWGATFLVVTLALSVASAIWPDSVSWKLPAITAGVSLAQFIGAFFTQPAARPAAKPHEPGGVPDDPGEPQPEDRVRALPSHDAADAPRAAQRPRGDVCEPADRRTRAGARGDPVARPRGLREPARPRVPRGARRRARRLRRWRTARRPLPPPTRPRP